MSSTHTRRRFLGSTLVGAAALAASSRVFSAEEKRKRRYDIGVAGISFSQMVGGDFKKLLGIFPVIREELELSFFDLTTAIMTPPSLAMVGQLQAASQKSGVAVRNILVGGEGNLGAKEKAERERAVRYHRKWIDVAADLGASAIRCNWGGEERGMLGKPEVERDFVVRSGDAFRALIDYGKAQKIDIMVENHGGASSQPRLVVALMKEVNDRHFGTLPDFGNFPPEIDRYEGIDAMMPWAKTISAKCYDFGPDGNELTIDFARMMEIVCDKHGYSGYVHIEYEGPRYAAERGVAPLDKLEGVRAAKRLLERLREVEGA
ncbi:TIM barrel protein [bacterium]|nr:TIM barrel protein [bacterium]